MHHNRKRQTSVGAKDLCITVKVDIAKVRIPCNIRRSFSILRQPMTSSEIRQLNRIRNTIAAYHSDISGRYSCGRDVIKQIACNVPKRLKFFLKVKTKKTDKKITEDRQQETLIVPVGVSNTSCQPPPPSTMHQSQFQTTSPF